MVGGQEWSRTNEMHAAIVQALVGVKFFELWRIKFSN